LTPLLSLNQQKKEARLTSRAFSFYNEWHEKCVKEVIT
jgi:hypothetical protein